jgi:hypothetical protein
MKASVKTYTSPVGERIVHRGVVPTTNAKVEPVMRAIPLLQPGYRRIIKRLRTNKAGTVAYFLVWDDLDLLPEPVAA